MSQPLDSLPLYVPFVPYGEVYGEGFEELGQRRPDVSALHELTGWVPILTVDEAVDDVIAYERGAGRLDGSARLAG